MARRKERGNRYRKEASKYAEFASSDPPDIMGDVYRRLANRCIRMARDLEHREKDLTTAVALLTKHGCRASHLRRWGAFFELRFGRPSGGGAHPQALRRSPPLHGAQTTMREPRSASSAPSSRAQSFARAEGPRGEASFWRETPLGHRPTGRIELVDVHHRCVSDPVVGTGKHSRGTITIPLEKVG
jgi:hypothetical protein